MEANVGIFSEWARGKGQRAKGKGQRARGKGQRAKGNGQWAMGTAIKKSDRETIFTVFSTLTYVTSFSYYEIRAT